MEAHKYVLCGVIELALDVLIINVCGNGIVNVKQSNGVLGNASADIFADSTVNVNLAGNGNSPSRQTAVYKAGNKPELCLKGRPALVCENNVLS